jgi:hypothetical protein
MGAGERLHAIGPLTNDRDVMEAFHREAFRAAGPRAGAAARRKLKWG